MENGFKYNLVTEPYPQIGWGNSIYTSLGLQRTFVENIVVCFCDILLSQANKHRQDYGSYAIGLSKDWAMQNGISPVRYVHSNSPGFSGELMEFSEIIKNQRCCPAYFVQKFVKHKTNKEINIQNLPGDARTVVKALETTLIKTLKYIDSGKPFFKAYELDNPLKRTQTERYYDEREWRASSNNPNDRLKFSWNDIRCIICDDEQECNELYEFLKNLQESLKIDSINSIQCKLFSFDNIEADF